MEGVEGGREARGVGGGAMVVAEGLVVGSGNDDLRRWTKWVIGGQKGSWANQKQRDKAWPRKKREGHVGLFGVHGSLGVHGDNTPNDDPRKKKKMGKGAPRGENQEKLNRFIEGRA